MHYMQKQMMLQVSIHCQNFTMKLARGAEQAGDHHCDGMHPQSSSSTTSLPCPMDGPDASSPGWAAYAALMYCSQLLSMA